MFLLNADQHIVKKVEKEQNDENKKKFIRELVKKNENLSDKNQLNNTVIYIFIFYQYMYLYLYTIIIPVTDIYINCLRSKSSRRRRVFNTSGAIYLYQKANQQRNRSQTLKQKRTLNISLNYFSNCLLITVCLALSSLVLFFINFNTCSS